MNHAIRRWATGLVVAASLAVPFAALSAETAAELVLCANREAPGEKRVEACTKVIANPSDAHARFRAYANRALAYFYMGRGDKAFPDYSQAILLEPENPLGYYLRGIARAAYDQYDAAVSDLSFVLSRTPEDVDALIQRAYSYSRLEKLDLAIVDYNVILKLRPKDSETLYARARAHTAKKDWERARADYNRLLELEPSYTAYFPSPCFAGLPFAKRGPLSNWPECEHER